MLFGPKMSVYNSVTGKTILVKELSPDNIESMKKLAQTMNIYISSTRTESPTSFNKINYTENGFNSALSASGLRSFSTKSGIF